MWSLRFPEGNRVFFKFLDEKCCTALSNMEHGVNRMDGKATIRSIGYVRFHLICVKRSEPIDTPREEEQ